MSRRFVTFAVLLLLSTLALCALGCGNSSGDATPDASVSPRADSAPPQADGSSPGADAGAGDDDGAAPCTPSTAGGVGSNDAGFGCGEAGIPGFCDNGVRQEPPTCDPTVDALLARTPLTCASKN